MLSEVFQKIIRFVIPLTLMLMGACLPIGQKATLNVDASKEANSNPFSKGLELDTVKQALNLVADILLLVADEDLELVRLQIEAIYKTHVRSELPSFEKMLGNLDLKLQDQEIPKPLLEEIGRGFDRALKESQAANEALYDGIKGVKSYVDLLHELASKINLDTAVLRKIANAAVTINKESMSKQNSDLLDALVPSYFLRQPSRNRLRMLADLIRYRPKTSGEFVALTVMRAGPIVQKVFQQVADLVPELKGSAAVLKDRLPAMLPEVVDKMVKTALGNQHSKLEIEEAPIGRATMAQVHRAKYGSKTVAVKVRRKGILKEAIQEKKLIMQLLPEGSSSRPLVEAIAQSVIEEASLDNEYDNIKKAASLGTGGVKAVSLIPGFKRNEDVVVMSFADGDSYNDVFSNSAVVTHTSFRRSFKETMSANIRSALFGGGLFNPDVHSGNFFYFKDKTGGTFYSTMIDLGSLPKLRKNEQRGLLCLLVHSSGQKEKNLQRFIDLLDLGKPIDAADVLALKNERSGGFDSLLETFGILIQRMKADRISVASFMRMMGSTGKMIDEFNLAIGSGAKTRALSLEEIVKLLIAQQPKIGFLSADRC